MISKFEDKGYVDVTKISAMRWFPEQEKGFIILQGERIAVLEEQYDKIEQAFLWVNKISIYDGLNKYRLIQKPVEGER